MHATTNDNPFLKIGLEFVENKVQITNLAAKLEVTHDDCNFSTSQQQDNEDQKQKSKDIINLVPPNGSEDEKEFNEDSTKG